MRVQTSSNINNYLRWFLATVCKTVCSMLTNRCLAVCQSCSVGILSPNGWMDQDATWYGGRPGPRRHCVRWEPCPPPKKRGRQSSPPLFDPCLLWPKGWMDQDATWYGCTPRPRPHCVRWVPISPPERGSAPPLFGPYLS